MSKSAFSSLAGVIFLIVAIAHVLRLAFKWEVIVDGLAGSDVAECGRRCYRSVSCV